MYCRLILVTRSAPFLAVALVKRDGRDVRIIHVS